MEIRKNLDNSVVDSLSFLLEKKRISCIKQKKGENVFSKNIFVIDTEKKESIQKVKKSLYKENDSNKFSFIDVSIINDEFTLIPLEYFEEELAEVFLNYNVPYSENKGLRYCWVPNFDLAIVFYYPEEIENYFNDLADKVRITHTGFKFLSKIAEKKTDGFHLCIYKEYFELIVINEQKLLIYNVYPYKIMQDILYFLQVISKKLSITLSDSTLYYYGNFEKNIDFFSSFIKSLHPGSDKRFELENYTTIDTL